MKTKMKRRFGMMMAAVVMLLASNVVVAQPGGQQGPPPIPSSKQVKQMVSEMAGEIALTAEQQETITKLYFDHFKEVEKTMEAGRPDREKMDALKSEFEKQVNAELTEEQQKKYDAYMKKNAPEGRGPGRPEK